MSNHLHPVPEEAEPGPDGGSWSPRRSWDEVSWPEDLEDELEALEFEPIARPRWWRWVALIVILALVVATPIAYGISVLLR
jgi:hypothetical protein